MGYKIENMRNFMRNNRCRMRSRKGMELVQVGIMIAVAVGLGLVFKDKTAQFVNSTFSSLLGSSFS